MKGRYGRELTGGKVDGSAWNKSRRVIAIDAGNEETVEESELVRRCGVLSGDGRKGGGEGGNDENGYEEHLECWPRCGLR